MSILDTAEGARLLAIRRGDGWRRWGPYLSDRQWGTVREDYSADGDAWAYLPHDHARSRAYRWGEDGIGGFGDDKLYWNLGVALWNGRDPFLKERFFGLSNLEGNHGEDVKEVYSFVDGLPTHAYMRMLYRYPQAAFPYEELVRVNGQRGQDVGEYELVDTGVFDGDRYFDVSVEYAKASPDDVLWRITVTNRGPEAAPLHVIPQLWARNIWSWDVPAAQDGPRPLLQDRGSTVAATHPFMRPMQLHLDGDTPFLFTENDTNVPRLFGTPAPGPFKDGIGDHVVHGRTAAVSGDGHGTKCGAPVALVLAPGESRTIRLRFRPQERSSDPFGAFDATFAERRAEADAFYAALQTDVTDPDCRLVQRQAFAGMLWCKQLYLFDVRRWLAGDPAQPKPPPSRTRDDDWRHLNNADIISMPDSWEYPWFAAWDLGFHCSTLALIDPDFAKAQLVLLQREWYMHPSGQLPAYEWNFSDSNPPVQAWAAWRVYEQDRALFGKADTPFIERIFHKLIMNFTWWVNRKDADGRNVFQGGFLGLDNIGVFDRSAPLPTGGRLDQADGTAWMAMYALNLLRMSLELAVTNPVYQDTGTKFFEHFLLIAEAMSDMGGTGVGLWDEQDGFFYDVLRLPDGHTDRLRVRSMVGLIPLMAVEVIGADLIDALPDFAERLRWYLDYRPDLAALISRWSDPGAGERRLLSLLRGHRMKKLLERMLAEDEFLSPYGVRSVSKVHAAHPYCFEHDGHQYCVEYAPAESTNRLFGGNSNWRGPIWFPVNCLLIESLRRFHDYYGDDFKVECPVGSGRMLNLAEVAAHLRQRLIALFRPGPDGVRPCLSNTRLWPGEPTLQFHEYFNGDNGQGLGASHQTGWTGTIAAIIQHEATAAAGKPQPMDASANPAAEPAAAAAAQGR